MSVLRRIVTMFLLYCLTGGYSQDISRHPDEARTVL